MVKQYVRPNNVAQTYGQQEKRHITPAEAAVVMRILDESKSKAHYEVSSLEDVNDVYRAWALEHRDSDIPLTPPQLPANISYPSLVTFQRLPTGKVAAMFIGGN